MLAIVGGLLVLCGAVFVTLEVLRERAETARTTPRFDPPVWAGQNVPLPCASGGFYVRDAESISLTIAGHCAVASPGAVWRDTDGRLIGTFGPPAQLPDCPVGRFCAPADIAYLARGAESRVL